ncbi:MAG: hypothetical protein RLZZ602_903 [Pseudomonadota bacterium]
MRGVSGSGDRRRMLLRGVEEQRRVQFVHAQGKLWIIGLSVMRIQNGLTDEDSDDGCAA